jgi:CDP-diacylglycerol--glycerol-3-phosphate 3-phosphatidyltransferase
VAPSETLGGTPSETLGAALSEALGVHQTGGWLIVTTLVALWVVGFLYYHLTDNRVAASDSSVEADDNGMFAVDGLRQSLGVANAVTFLRGLAYAGAAGFVVVRPTGAVVVWLPALLYGGGAALDAVDGSLARRVGAQTRLGERLDLGYDTLGFLVAPAVAVAWGKLPAVYLSLSFARYLYRGGLAVERSRGRAIRPLPPSRLRRPLAAWQMLFLAVALAPVVPAAWTLAVAPAALAPSLLVFARDYLAVTGRLSSRTDATPAAESASAVHPESVTVAESSEDRDVTPTREAANAETTDDVASERTVTERSATEQPATEQSATEQPVTEGAVTKQPATERSGTRRGPKRRRRVSDNDRGK